MAVLEPPSGKTTGLIGEKLRRHGEKLPVVITRSDRMESFNGEYDLLVIAPGEYTPLGEGVLNCRVLLVPGNVSAATLGCIRSRWVVSYGMSGKDSITVSSLETDCAILALQRELVTLDDQVIEQQELPIRFPGRSGSDRVMAAYGSLLILGLSPESLAETIHAQSEAASGRAE